ncbi:MAG: AsmA family protein, partial [Pseudomonadota bacterium]
MQNTLLGVGIALILALVSALVAPLVIDWNRYRATVEAEASRLTGLDVRVNGTIDARLLPSPALTLRDVTIGQAGQAPQFRAATLKVEVALGPLLGGRVEASNVQLIGAQLYLGLDRAGAVRWPALSPSFRPQALSISHFNIEDGRVILTDAASGSRLVLQKVWFSGHMSSFAG